MLAFLTEVVLPVYRQAAWKLRRVLTDRGNEFKGAFDDGLARLGIRHTRTKPRQEFPILAPMTLAIRGSLSAADQPP